MIRDILFQHKEERDQFLSKTYVQREQLPVFKEVMRNGLIKIVIGPRRAGKSSFLFIGLKGEDFAYVNFDDETLLSAGTDDIIKGIHEVYGNTKTIFFDEIQELANWELFVNKLHRRGYNIILTGSNSHLLSKELATHLTGRHSLIQILPFSFKEYLTARNAAVDFKKEHLIPEQKGIILHLLEEYILKGGFPEPALHSLNHRQYLENLFDAIILKDVVRRYKVKFSQKMYELALYLLTNTAGEYTFTRVKNTLAFKSANTVQNYTGYLESSYLLSSLNRFSFKVSEQIKSGRKIYCVDNGFITSKAFRFSKNTGKLMENTVFTELMRMGSIPNKEIFFYKTKKGSEIDFVIREGLNISQLIQVSYDINDPRVMAREFRAFIDAAGELSCENFIVITWDYEGVHEYENERIFCVPLWKWLIQPKFN